MHILKLRSSNLFTLQHFTIIWQFGGNYILPWSIFLALNDSTSLFCYLDCRVFRGYAHIKLIQQILILKGRKLIIIYYCFRRTTRYISWWRTTFRSFGHAAWGIPWLCQWFPKHLYPCWPLWDFEVCQEQSFQWGFGTPAINHYNNNYHNTETNK